MINKNQLHVMILVSLLSAFSTTNASPPHTWHTVNATQGTWQGKLQMLNQGGHFVNREGSQISEFSINKEQSFDYGFSFDKGDDFDLSYALTLVLKTSPAFVSKACVFVITASGPAKPDIRVSSFNGAKCEYKVVHGRGEDFSVE